MNKLFKLIGALFLVAAAVLGSFFNFSGDTVISLAVASFGLAFIVISVIKEAKEKGSLNWITYLIIVLSIIGGILVCVGGASESIITSIVGAAIALISVILSIISISKQ